MLIGWFCCMTLVSGCYLVSANSSYSTWKIRGVFVRSYSWSSVKLWLMWDVTHSLPSLKIWKKGIRQVWDDCCLMTMVTMFALISNAFGNLVRDLPLTNPRESGWLVLISDPGVCVMVFVRSPLGPPLDWWFVREPFPSCGSLQQTGVGEGVRVVS